MTEDKATAAKNRVLLVKLLVVAMAMFAFALFVMPPIYNVFCEITGLNGKTNSTAAQGPERRQDDSRKLTVQFLADVDPGLPWEFRPDQPGVDLHPGEITQVRFHVKNTAGHDIVGRAVPSISPSEAARYFKKTQCFCFNEQTLKAGEEKDMAVIFYVDPSLPRHIGNITLAYKFYNLTDKKAEVTSR